MSRAQWRRGFKRAFAMAAYAVFLVGFSQHALGQEPATKRADGVDVARADEASVDAPRMHTQTNGWFVYEGAEQNLCVLAYIGPATNQLVIPQQINGGRVQRIAHRAFYKRGFASVSIPDSVCEIGAFAFGECTNLVTVAIPGKVQKIDDFSFLNCSHLTRVDLNDEVEDIGKMAFAGCERLTQIHFPNRLCHISDGAFIQTKLAQIDAPASLVEVGVGAFAQCDRLTNVLFRASGVTVQANAFGECAHLTAVTFLGTVRKVGVFAFTGCPALHTVRFKIPTFRIMDPTAFKDSPHVNFYQISKEGDVKLERMTLFMKEDH